LASALTFWITSFLSFEVLIVLVVEDADVACAAGTAAAAGKALAKARGALLMVPGAALHMPGTALLMTGEDRPAVGAVMFAAASLGNRRFVKARSTRSLGNRRLVSLVLDLARRRILVGDVSLRCPVPAAARAAGDDSGDISGDALLSIEISLRCRNRPPPRSSAVDSD
jgi:hypothetical protein